MAKKTAKKAKKASPKKSASKPMKPVSQKAPVQPLGDRVLVRHEEMPDKKSPSGIILPDNAQKEKSKLGTVIAVGPGRIDSDGKRVPMSVEVGMKVIFNKGWGDNDVPMEDDRDYFIVAESDILAILNK